MIVVSVGWGEVRFGIIAVMIGVITLSAGFFNLRKMLLQSEAVEGGK